MKRKRKGHPQSPKARQTSMKNFDIYRLRGMIESLKEIKTRSKSSIGFDAAQLSINEIIRNLKNVSN